MGCASAKPAPPMSLKTTLQPKGARSTEEEDRTTPATTNSNRTQEPSNSRGHYSWVKDELSFKAHLARVSNFSQLEKKYELGPLLGEGITGQVRWATSKIDGQVYALKSLNVTRMDESQVAELKAEIEMLKQLDHPNVVALMDIFESERNICLVMEYCGGGDLSDRRFKSEKDLASVLYQTLLAVAHCHHLGIIHRDVKLENIMFASKQSDDLRLIDFGLSKTFFQQSSEPSLNETTRMMGTVCGTVNYMAPEMLTRNYSEKADIWAVGVIGFTLMTGDPPFSGQDDREVLRKVRDGVVEYNSRSWARLSPHAMEFIKALLSPDPSLRPSAQKALNMPWMITEHQRRLTERPINIDLAKRAWESLLRFATYPLLKKAAWMIMAYHATLEEKKDLQYLFLYLDKDFTGELKLGDIQRLMIEFADPKLTEEQLTELFNVIDQDRTNVIRHMEFLSATIEATLKPTPKLIDDAFDHLDADASGVITANNLFDLLGERYSLEDAKNILAQGFHDLDMEPQEGVTRTLFFQMIEKVGLPSPFTGTTSPASKTQAQDDEQAKYHEPANDSG